jgi:hypothetical protein
MQSGLVGEVIHKGEMKINMGKHWVVYDDENNLIYDGCGMLAIFETKRDAKEWAEDEQDTTDWKYVSIGIPSKYRGK